MANLSFAIICIHQDDSSDVSWSRSTQGLLLAGGFYGAIASPILTGYLSDKYGRCKLQLLLSVVTVSLADVLSPTIIVHLGDGCYFALRILMGLAAVNLSHAHSHHCHPPSHVSNPLTKGPRPG